ncbi:heme-degrading domain-containing protein [Oscillibacter sp.]|uniref:heme-degrading domain-containing protein n=1 Tax=Oscillibacter sp. TaxID=1945593 RepID=UPI0026110A4E|nr:heme-degrading domain-containing protein [Oscillibacter sp.]MDD3347535.1 heme-degrading domain-containing protein [Oscillibacter sp.]
MEENLKEALARRKWEEETLCFSAFSNEDALTLGLKIIEKAKQRGVAVAIDITVNGTELFHYTMQGANARNAMWIKRKQNMVQVSQISSLHAGQFLESEGKDQWKNWRLNDTDYTCLGGGFPILLKGTGVIGAVACSGLPHEEDHRLLVDSISDLLGIHAE